MKIGDGNVFTGLKKLTTALPEKFDIIGGPDSDVPFWTLFTGMIIVNFIIGEQIKPLFKERLEPKTLRKVKKGFY
jgi:SSS family solute:Na+ symporter